jgi:hypothetical protein
VRRFPTAITSRGCALIVRALRVTAIADSGQRYGGRAFVDCLQAARERPLSVDSL